MNEIQVFPTICAVIAWGFSMNIIMAVANSVERSEALPSIVYTSTFTFAGKCCMFTSMVVMGFSSGLWSLLIAPVGGMFVGASTSAILGLYTSVAWSLPCAIAFNFIGAVLLLAM